MFGTLSGGFWLAMLAVWGVRHLLLKHYQYRLWRLVRTLVVLGVIAFLVRVGGLDGALAGRLAVWLAVGGAVGGVQSGRTRQALAHGWAHVLRPISCSQPASVPHPSTHPHRCQVCAIIFIPDAMSAGMGIKNLVLIVFANFSAAAFLVQLLLYTFRGSLVARRLVDQAYR